MREKRGKRATDFVVPPPRSTVTVWRGVINTEIRMTLFMRGPRLVMQIEFMAKSYDALGRYSAVVNVTSPCISPSLAATVRNQDNEAKCAGERE